MAGILACLFACLLSYWGVFFSRASHTVLQVNQLEWMMIVLLLESLMYVTVQFESSSSITVCC